MKGMELTGTGDCSAPVTSWWGHALADGSRLEGLEARCFQWMESLDRGAVTTAPSLYQYQYARWQARCSVGFGVSPQWSRCRLLGR